MLLKGIDEARGAARPLAAADMVLVRLAHAADLPTPDEALRALRDGGTAQGESPPVQSARPDGGARMATSLGTLRNPPEARPEPSPVARPEAASRTSPQLASFADVVALAGRERELKLKHALETYVRPIRFDQGRIELALTEDAAPDLVGELSRKLEDWTGRRWMIAVARDGGAPTIEEARQSARDRLVDDARADPTVAAVLARFPGAEIVDVRVRAEHPDILGGADATPLPDPDDTIDEDD